VPPRTVPPRSVFLQQDDTHRLIPARYIEGGASVLARIAGTPRQVEELFELEGATNDRLLGESNLLPGISVHELVFATPNYHLVNASFTHARPGGGRFNGPGRGAWYAAFAIEAAEAEVAYHRGRELAEIGWEEEEISVYREVLADFRSDFHDLRGDARYRDCLDPDSYRASQSLVHELLAQGSAGIVYPSVRHRGHGSCVACFRPALVTNVRRRRALEFTFRPGEDPGIRILPDDPGATP
jgi:RES domain-containing protein